MQASSDIFLGWRRVDGIDDVRRDFYVRQLKDWKGSIDPEQMLPAGLAAYGRVCGWTLARAHARSGDRIAIAAYLGTSPAFDRAIVSFAEAYTDQNQRDYESLKKAVDDGRVTAQDRALKPNTASRRAASKALSARSELRQQLPGRSVLDTRSASGNSDPQPNIPAGGDDDLAVSGGRPPASEAEGAFTFQCGAKRHKLCTEAFEPARRGVFNGFPPG